MVKRFLSAFVMIILFIPLVILGGYYFKVGFTFVGILAFKELVDLKKHHHKIPNFIVILSFTLFILFVLWENCYLQKIALLFLLLFFPSLFYKENKYTTQDAIYLSGSLLFLATVFYSFLHIREYDIWHFWYLVLVPIVTDIFAMQVGQRFGRRKCCPSISPDKTWEGVVGGTLFSVIIATWFYSYFIGNLPIYKIVLFTFLLSVVGQLGDLVFSKIKRENEIKDFSGIIPGHGGILDRLDSIIFVVLLYVLVFNVL